MSTGVKRCVLSLIIIVVSAAVPARAAITGYMDDAHNEEPSVVEVQRSALAYHNLEEREVSRWKKRARLSALLPQFQVSYDRRVKNDIDIDISENIYVGSSGVTVGPDEGSYAQNANSDQSIGVKAVWYLGDLIFNPDQLDISRESRNLIRERQMLMSEVNRHYYERQRLKGVLAALGKGKAVPLEGAPKTKGRKNTGSVAVDAKHQLFLAQVRFEEETAALDALTGGWFSSRIGR